MNSTKRGPNFKPYTGTDYEQFKKNHGTAAGFLGFDFDNPNYKEKVRTIYILSNLKILPCRNSE